jgi:hypothetical protein
MFTPSGQHAGMGANIKKQPGANGQQNMGRWTPMEVAVKRTTWKSLLDNMYLEGAAQNIKGDGDAYK